MAETKAKAETKEKVAEAKAETKEKAIKEEKPVKPKNPFDEKVKRMYPLDRVEGSHIYAEVNGRGYQVQRGIEVEIPKPIAEVIDNKFKMQFVEDEYINAHQTYAK